MIHCENSFLVLILWFWFDANDQFEHLQVHDRLEKRDVGQFSSSHAKLGSSSSFLASPAAASAFISCQ